jgi:class 3 adenylate cyclase
MTQEGFKRKLSAILCAFVVGYSRLMGEDESYTVNALKECRHLFAENIDNHGGQVAKTPGDSTLDVYKKVQAKSTNWPGVCSLISTSRPIYGQIIERACT